MKIKLFAFAIFFLLTVNCSAKINVIILVDSRIFVNTDNIADFSNYERAVCEKMVRDKIWNEDRPENTYSLYTFLPMNDKFLAQEIYLWHYWRNLNLGEYSSYTNLRNAKLYSNTFELLKNINDRTRRLKPQDYPDKTIVIVFSKSTFSYSYDSKVPTMLSFKEIINNKAIKVDYKTMLPPGADPIKLGIDTNKMNTMIIQVSQYLVKRSVDNVFLGTGEDGKKPVLFDCNRKTAPGSESLKLFTKQAHIDLKTTLLQDDKIVVDSAVLSYIKGKNSEASLLPEGRQVVFSAKLNALPPGLTGEVSNSTPFPLFDMIQPYLVLKGTTPVDTAYLGQMIVKYRLLDPVYSRMTYADTINFKINVDAPEYLYLGGSRKVLLDNAALIKYGNELSPGKAGTQDELTKDHKAKLRLVIYITIVLLIIIIILFWFFIRKNKKLTLANIRTFWR